MANRAPMAQMLSSIDCQHGKFRLWFGTGVITDPARRFPHGVRSMSIKQFKVSSQARDQLIRLKTRTSVSQWNILCRWAFCLSLQQATPPTPVDVPADSNVEMTWQVFGGDCHELYLALLKERCQRDGLGTGDDVLARQFRLHLHRGISYLATPGAIKGITDLVRLATENHE